MNYLELERTLARHLHLGQQAELCAAPLTGELRLAMSATPAYRLNPDGTADVSCDLFTCHIFRENGKALCQLEMHRAEAKASAEAPYGLLSLRRYPIQAMKPWPYTENEDPFAALGSYPVLPVHGCGDSAAFGAIRNLQNMFFEHRLHGPEELFSGSEEAELEIEALGIAAKGKQIFTRCREVLDRENENAHCYLFLGVTGMPVIEVEADGTRARGLFMTQLYEVHAAAYHRDPKDWTLHRTLAVTESEYVREKDGWKIFRMHIRNLVPLPTVPYSVSGRYDRCGQSTLPWEIAQLYGKPPAPDDCMEIENIIHGWAYGCRRGTLPEFVESRIRNPMGKNRMWIKSFGESTPVLDTLDKIRMKIHDMTAQYRENYYTFHAPTTPVLQAAGESRVLATWFDCAATSLRSMAKTPEAVPYMAFVNKYTHRFEKMGGKWYLVEFKNEPMIALPDWELNMTDNIGWLQNSKTRRFPDAFGEEKQ